MAVTGAIFNSLSFGGVNSADYGIYITGEAVFNAPKRAVEMVSVPGRNGSVAIDQGHWENLEVTYPAGTFGMDASEFATALSNFRNAIVSQIGYQRLTDTYHPDEYRMALYADGLEAEPTTYNSAGEFELKFNCKPQRWLANGETPVTVSSGDTLTNPTPYDAGPLLAVKGYGNIGFNGYSVVLDPAFIGNITLIGSVSATSSINRNYAGSYLMPNDEITLSGASLTRRFIPTEGQAEQIIDATVTFTSQETSGTVSVRSSVVGRTAIDVTFNYMNQKFSHGSNTYLVDEANVSITYKDSDSGETKRVLFTMRIRINNTIASTSVPKLYFDSRMETVPGGWMTQGISISISSLTGDSTQSRLGDPTYVDCDLGEAYKYVDDVPISLNGFIDLGSDLPTLASGENEITYDNTITELKVTPNWWKL